MSMNRFFCVLKNVILKKNPNILLTGFSVGKNLIIELEKMADDRLPKGYPFCTDNSSNSFLDRKFFVVVFFLADQLYIYQ